MPNIRCKNCGLLVMVPAGGRRLCGCGAWLSGDEPSASSRPAERREASPGRQAGEDAPLATTVPAEPIFEATPADWAERGPRIEGDLSAIERLNDGYRRIRKELAKAIVGQERVLEELLISIFARGHCLLIGVPGLAKTLIIRTLADSLSLSFSRVQFTPDLMPSDITGTEVLQEDKATGQRMFKFLHGPLFANVVLADEINRTPPKTQAALLEAMQERQVTVGGTRHRLPEPFFVLATQNPIEQEGTYPLPEAQQDRFMFNILVDYPEEEEEFRIVEMTTSTHTAKIDRMLSATDILEMQDIVRKVPVAPYVIRYAMKFTRLTRKAGRPGAAGAARTKSDADLPPFVRDYVTWGAGPRASQYLILAAKARAVLHGRYYVSCEDVRSVAPAVLRHRIITNFAAEAEGIKPDDIVRWLTEMIPRDPSEKAEAAVR
jgi:MoxR-like ATPase